MILFSGITDPEKKRSTLNSFQSAAARHLINRFHAIREGFFLQARLFLQLMHA